MGTGPGELPQVRLGVPDDAARLTDLHLDVWDEAYAGLLPAEVLAARRAERAQRTDRWRTALAVGATWVADDGDRLVGFTTAGPSRAADAPIPFELWALYVRRAAYGTGLGQRLFDVSVGDRAAYLWVLRGNDRAIAFYRRQGFIVDGAQKPQYDTVDLRMVRDQASGRA